MSKIITIEVDNEKQKNLMFRPLGGQKIRGRFSHQRFARHARDALLAGQGWPEFIPGQVIGIDLSANVGFVDEPLHEKAHAETRKLIEERGMRLDPPRQTFPLATDEARQEWLWGMKCAVGTGAAKLLGGEFPRDLAPPPRQPSNDPIDRLCCAIERLLERISGGRREAAV